MTYTLSQVTESVGTITLDHERRRNALSHALVEEVIAALRSFQEAKVRVVILRAKAGAKVFSAGHDIDELPENSPRAAATRSIWQSLAAGAVADDDAQALAERLHARRGVLRGEIKPVGIPPSRPSIFPPRRLQRSLQRPVAIARRRHLAASGPMPPALACKFTVSELAVLRIIGDEVRQHGQCDRCVDELAARAGVCRRMVQNA